MLSYHYKKIQPVVNNMTAKMNKVELPGSMGTMISSYSDKITSLMSMYTDYEDYIPLMKAFIGDGSDKVYLLAAQNTAEIRAAGGFPGSIGTIRVEDGVMSIGDFNPVNDVLATYPPLSSVPSGSVIGPDILRTFCIIVGVSESTPSTLSPCLAS